MFKFKFKFLSQYIVIDPQPLQINPGCLKCNSGINLSPVNKKKLMVFFISNFIKANPPGNRTVWKRCRDIPLYIPRTS